MRKSPITVSTGRIRYERAWALVAVVSVIGCSDGPDSTDATPNNGMSGFECGPKAPEPSSCEHSNFQRPERGFCQGFVRDEGAIISRPVPDDEATAWSCIECLTDDDCLPGTECGGDWECDPGSGGSPDAGTSDAGSADTEIQLDGGDTDSVDAARGDAGQQKDGNG